MDNIDVAIEKLRAAAEAARQAAQATQAYSDQLAAAGHAASGGAIDPFVFRLAIFALAVFVGYCRLVGDASASYAADVRDKRHFLGDRCRRPPIGRGRGR